MEQITASVPAWVGVSTGNPAIDQAFRISVALVDDLRAQYLASGALRGWLPVSGGVRGPLVTESDARDSAHAVKMAAYLWGHEAEQAAVMENAMFLAKVDAETGAIQAAHPRIAVLAGMYCRCAADTYRYFPPGPRFAEALQRAARTVAWITREYDPEDSGLLDCRNDAERAFWGAHLGEPAHFPPNYDPKSKVVNATMAYAIWLQSLAAAARAADSAEADVFARRLARVRQVIEEQAWSERHGYYRLQFDRLSDRWFFSLNGLSEQSRETDVVAYYAAEGAIAAERQRSVARWIDQALMRDRIFPMPIFYPTYAWYSPQHPNYIDCGPERSVLGGSWDTPFFHCVELLREVGLIDTLELAVRRRAEAIARDQDCLEWYYRDGTVDNATGFHRDRYLVCGTALIAAVIEGLFGVTPAAPDFAAINIAPALPLYRRHRHTTLPSPYAERDNTLRVTLPSARRLELTIRYSETDEVLRVRTNALGAAARFRLPVDLVARVKRVCWAGAEISYRLRESMDQAFVTVDHVLDGGELTVHLAPHPQKGRGTTPLTCYPPGRRGL